MTISAADQAQFNEDIDTIVLGIASRTANIIGRLANPRTNIHDIEQSKAEMEILHHATAVFTILASVEFPPPAPEPPTHPSSFTIGTVPL